MATTFIIQRAIEKGGIFLQEAVATLCRLAGWSEGSGVCSMHVKRDALTQVDCCTDMKKKTYVLLPRMPLMHSTEMYPTG